MATWQSQQTLWKVLRLMLILSLLLLFVATPSIIYGHTSTTDATGRSTSPLASWRDFWIFRLALNLLGYSTLVVPCYVFYQWLKGTGYLESQGKTCPKDLLKLFFLGQESGAKEDAESATKHEPRVVAEPNFYRQCVILSGCFFGLNFAYLTWGVLQERIMAYEYGTAGGKQPGEHFKNSQFLVFVNRILAFVTAAVALFITRNPKHPSPLYKYSYSSFSNIMSSWFQYEALKFVSFPTQVLAKASKVIPVMLMGKLVSKKSYQLHEYLTAMMISIGLFMFLFTSQDSVKEKTTVTTFSGIILLLGYLAFDAFTSNWQGRLFSEYKMSPLQMMCGVNLFSVLFTTVTLVEQGGFVESLEFMARHPTFILHSFLLSMCSALGQLVIFFTISTFGPVTFTIIMTLRQGLAILLSCLIYKHPVTVIGVFGVFVVFGAIFLRIYFNNRQRKMAKSSEKSPDSGVRT